MLKLNGFAASNYYNKVKLALLEKGVAFEEVLTWANKAPELLAKSPLGKIPFLETENGIICESQVLLEYVEATYPQPALLPADPFAAAKVRELITFMELYLELVARQMIGAALFGETASDEAKAKVKETLKTNVQAFAQLAKFGPYVAGAEMTLADCCAIFHFPLISMISNKLYGEDLLAPLNLGDYLKLMGERPHVRKAQADMVENFALLGARRKQAAEAAAAAAAAAAK